MAPPGPPMAPRFVSAPQAKKLVSRRTIAVTIRGCTWSAAAGCSSERAASTFWQSVCGPPNWTNSRTFTLSFFWACSYTLVAFRRTKGTAHGDKDRSFDPWATGRLHLRSSRLPILLTPCRTSTVSGTKTGAGQRRNLRDGAGCRGQLNGDTSARHGAWGRGLRVRPRSSFEAAPTEAPEGFCTNDGQA